MSQLVEEYAKEYAKEYAQEYVKEYVKEAVNEAELTAAIKLLKNGVPVNVIVESFSSLSVELLKALQKQLV